MVVGRSLLSQDVPQSIQNNTSFHNITEIYRQNHRYHSGKDNFFFHSPYNYQTDILWNRLIWIQAKPCITAYYTERSRLRKKWIIKLSVGADMLKQIICAIKIRRAPKRHDNIDFQPIITKEHRKLGHCQQQYICDKGYDSEKNHVFVREGLKAYSIIPARYPHVPIWETHGRYRKQMKRGHSKPLYNQRNKDETIISVIKRLFGEHVTSRLVKTQNRELSFRCIAYNMHRVTNLFLLLMISTEPIDIQTGYYSTFYQTSAVHCSSTTLHKNISDIVLLAQ